MWVSTKRLKSADKYIRIVILCIAAIILISSNLTYNSESTNEMNDEATPQIITSIAIPEYQKMTNLHLSETDAPAIGPPAAVDLFYSEGIDVPPEFRWKITDASPGNYTVYRNGTYIVSANYTSGAFINVPIDGVAPGFYNYTILAIDSFGNSATDIAYATITDDLAPVFVPPTLDFNISEGSLNNEVSWTFTDLRPKNYTVTRNESYFAEGNWSDSQAITVNIDGLPLGMHNFTIKVVDESGNSNNDFVIIHVADDTPPTVLSSDDPLRFSEFDIGRNLVVNVTDTHPGTYIIYQDGNNVTDGIWANGTLITYNLDHLPIENYSFMVQVFDEFYKFVEIYIDVEIYKVIILNTKVPQISITSQVREGDYETIQSIWVDEFDDRIENGSITLSLYQGQLLIDQAYYLNQTDNLGNFDLKLNYTGLAVSDYRWEILFEGINYVSQTLHFNFTVSPHTYEIVISDLPDLTQGAEYTIEITVVYANPSSNLRLNSLTQKTGSVSGVEVELNMLVIILDGSQTTITKSGSSNSDGKVTFTLSIFETSIIASVDSLSVTTLDDQFSNPSSINLLPNQFPVIISIKTSTESSSNDDQAGQLQIIEDYLIFLFGGLFVLFILIFMFRKMGKTKKQQTEDLQEAYDLSLTEVKAISSIQLVLLTSKTGLPLYERQFKTMFVDSVLLSGVTSAISSLLSEAHDQQIFGLEIMESRGLSITSHKRDTSSLIFISSSSLPMIILNQMVEAHEAIENKYSQEILTNISNIIPSDDINKIFRDHELKLDLSSDIEIDIFAIDKFHSDGKTKNGVKSLAGVLLDIDVNELEMKDVGRLIEIYEENGFERNYAANFILHAYKEGMIKSKIK